jgi:DNA topoisomerase IA
MRLVVDREKEIEAFIPTESWKMRVQFDKKLVAELSKVGGKAPGFKTQKEIEAFLKNF